jgi:hypothetical protein
MPLLHASIALGEWIVAAAVAVAVSSILASMLRDRQGRG